jgi:hypothetical protein
MKFLGLLLMMFVTTSLMSMEENKKQYFLMDYNSGYGLPYDKNKPYLKDRLPLNRYADKAFKQACEDACKRGKGQALFAIDNKQVLAKISSVRMAGFSSEDFPCLMIKIKPWNKVNLLDDNQ